MNQITVVHQDGTSFELFSRKNVSGATKATQKMALLSDDLLSLSVVSATPLNFIIGDTINVYGKPYKLNQLPAIKKLGTRNYEYELELEGMQYELLDIQFQMPENTYGDYLYTDLAGLLDALIWNIKRVGATTWEIKNTTEGNTAYKNMSVGTKNCLQVLQEACSEYDVEFTVTISGSTRVLNIGNSVGIVHEFKLQYGKNKGLYQLERQNVNNAGITTRLFCYGSTENLGNAYRHTRLCLPDKERLGSYIEDADAIAEFGIKEATKQWDDIKPQRVGAITAEGEDVLTFVDKNDGKTVYVNSQTYPAMFDLNEKDDEGNTKYLIAGVEAQITFQTGNLAGYTFDIHSYDHDTRTFVINKFTDENGLEFPSALTAARQFAAGDEYIISEINLPDSYIEDAEAELYDKGEEELGNLVQPQVSYKLSLDEFFFITLWGRDVDTEVLHVGDYIEVEDDAIGVDKAVRITRIERNILRPHSYDITLSDTTTKTITTRVLGELQSISDIVTVNKLGDISKARRRWMATRELYNMVFDTEGHYYSDKIAPLAIETTMLSVAAKSQQFTLIGAIFRPNEGGDANCFAADDFKLAHYALFENVCTFDITGATYSKAAGNRLTSSTAYYIYARCPKAEVSADLTTGTGQLVLETAQHQADESNYYYFLIGVLNSVVDDVRAISLTYGATTINGAFITTGKIQSQDENTWLDLDGNAFQMGDGSDNELSWNKDGNGKLVIKGGIVQNAGGDEATIGLYRGTYNSSYTYYPGDEVTYTVSGVTSTYRRKGTTKTKGIAPTNTTYWQVLAAGVSGDGAFVLDVDDEMVQVAVNSAGEVEDLQSWTLNVKAYYGAEETDDITYTVEVEDNTDDDGDELLTVGSITSDGQLTVATSSGVWAQLKTVKINITAEAGWATGVTRTVTIRFFAVFPGEDGSDAELYALLPSLSQITFARSSDGTTLTPTSRTLTVSVKKTVGSTTSVISVPSGYYVRYSYTGTPTTSSSTIGTSGITISSGTSYSCLYIALFKGSTLIDKETIPIIKDGIKGNDGDDAPYYLYMYQWSGSRTTAPDVDNDNINPGDSWSKTQESSPGTLYYLWRIFAQVNADGKTLLQYWSDPVRVTPVEVGRRIYVKGTRHNGTTAAAPVAMVDDTSILGTYSRGLCLRVLAAADLSLTYSANFDVYGNASTTTIETVTAELVEALEDYMSREYIIVLFSFDALSFLSSLLAALHKFGSGFKTTMTAQRYAFAFIGRFGLEPGQAILASGNTTDSVEVSACVVDGELVANGASGEINENLVNNSECKESFTPEDSSSGNVFIRTNKVLATIPEGMTCSGQVKVTLTDCSFASAGATLLVYFGSSSSWPEIGYLENITANGTYYLKNERFPVNSGEDFVKYIYIRHSGFFATGTITIERVKVEVGGVCTDWSPSAADRRGAATPYRGEYDSAATYYGTTIRNDIVKYNEVYYIARADVGTFTGQLPTNTDYWNEFGGQYESVATKLLFAEFAYIENLGVHDLLTSTSGKRVHISQEDNSVSIYDEDDAVSVVLEGEEHSDSELFGGSSLSVTPTNTSTSFQTGNALHPNATYTWNQTNGSFTFAYAGAFTGQVVVTLKATGSYNLQSGAMSQVAGANIYVYLDSVLLATTSLADLQTGNSNTVTVAFSKNITAGTHTLKTVVKISNPNYDGSSSYTVTASSTFSGCQASADVRISRYFSNGNAVGCSSTQYAETIIENSKLLQKAEAGNVGYSLNNGVLKIKIAGTWYTASRNSSTGALTLTAT